LTHQLDFAELRQERMNKNCGLGAIAQIQSIQNIRYMVFDCSFGNVEELSNLSVTGSLSNQL
jgi:hypothetical protein